MTQNATSLRLTAHQNIIDSVTEAASKGHERNYEKLHVRRDGSVSWFESINASDDIIDGHADHFCAVPSVVTVGTGSYACNCDYCEDKGYETRADAIADAVAESDIAFLEESMLKALDGIPAGYFNDEQ
jgi:hypothetical protein